MVRLLVLTGLLLTTLCSWAQDSRQKQQEADMNGPTFVPTVKVGKILENGDSIQYMEMNNVYVYPPITFSSKKQQQAYTRLVKNVKTVLPIAKEARAIMMETAEFLETLPDKKAKEAHMKMVEKSIMKEYKPRMKKLTFSQGLPREQLVGLRTHTGLPRTRSCRLLPGLCLGFRCQPQEEIRP